MKIGHILNMANNGYHIVKALRKNGVDAELIISSADFGMALPVWEEEEIDEDPYNVQFKNLLKKYDLPPFVKIWKEERTKYLVPQKTKNKRTNPITPQWLRKISRGIRSYLWTSPDLYKIAKEYDILHLHPPSPILLHFMKKKKVIHEAGWIRRLMKIDSVTEKYGRRSYEKADAVVWTNPDTYPLLAPLNIKKLKFIPFVIDPEQYKPTKEEKTEELLFFHPARQVWDIKGNDRLLKAFAKFIHSGYRAKLRLIDWGFEEDVTKAKQLITKEKINDFVEWRAPYSKPGLIRAYSEADVVFDQFLLGSGGTACFEAMSCEAPLVIHLNQWNIKCFGEMPPIFNASKIEEIYNTMIDLTDPKLRRTKGHSERNFTLKHNHPDIIAKQLITLYRGIYP